jgi:hypothetical protein
MNIVRPSPKKISTAHYAIHYHPSLQLTVPGNVVVLTNLSYDATEERIRVFDTISAPNSKPSVMDVLVLFKKVGLTTEGGSQICNK